MMFKQVKGQKIFLKTIRQCQIVTQNVTQNVTCVTQFYMRYSKLLALCVMRYIFGHFSCNARYSVMRYPNTG